MNVHDYVRADYMYALLSVQGYVYSFFILLSSFFF